MAYTALGPRVTDLDRFRAAYLARRQARRTGPAGRGPRRRGGVGSVPRGRGSFEERALRRNAEERAAKAFFERMGMEKDRHELSMRLGEDKLAQADFDRDLALRQADHAERLAASQGDLARTREERLRAAMERQMGLEARQQDFAEGPAFGLQERAASETERRNRAIEEMQRQKMNRVDPEVVMRTLAAVTDPETPPGQKRVLAQSLLAMMRRGQNRPDPAAPGQIRTEGGAPAPAGDPAMAMLERASTQQMTGVQVREALVQQLPAISNILKTKGAGKEGWNEALRQIQELLQMHLPGVSPVVLRAALFDVLRGETGRTMAEGAYPDERGGFRKLFESLNRSGVDYEALRNQYLSSIMDAVLRSSRDPNYRRRNLQLYR